MVNRRALNLNEIFEAQKVFKNSINYQKVFIEKYDGGAMTWAYQDTSENWYWIIFWSKDVYDNGALSTPLIKRTFIHEMTHVWQGQNGTLPREYMFKSVVSQTGGGIKDIWEKGFKELVNQVRSKGVIGAWHTYRGRAYAFSMSEIGTKNFNNFNVEQQASIVESWYAPDLQLNHLGEEIPGGNMSPNDVRYPYITGNILAKSPNAPYAARQNLAPSNAPQLGKGADAKIKAIQDILVQLRYLDPKHADGYMGRRTRDAVRGFQLNNGLKPDGDIGGANSATRKKLGIR